MVPISREETSNSGQCSTLSTFDSPYPVGTCSSLAIISPKFTFSPDPRDWGSALFPDLVESDDDLDTPSSKENSIKGFTSSLSSRAFRDIACLSVLCVVMLVLFVGYPVITYYKHLRASTLGGFNLGGINSTGQIPVFINQFGLIDTDTPPEVYTKTSWEDGKTQMHLVFSDEFNIDGRSFYPGDDPYWEAVDLFYWATNDLEWYDPGAVTTQGGSLVITLSEKEIHNLNYESGLVSTWNKFCFTGGYVETSVQLPGANNVLGFWPAIWTLGNLGRAGYGATLEGVWPYAYDSCDIGTVANQTINGQPAAATVDGDPESGGVLSYLPGQRLSRCTCPGESHPGPKHGDGTFVGRSAPEIDVFEAQINQNSLIAEVSQSAQWAPLNRAYNWLNTSENMIIANPSISKMNPFMGTSTQQATSIVTNTDPSCYELDGGCYSLYGFEYKPGFDDGYITWVSNNQTAWTIKAAGMGPDPSVQISARPVSQEPMYLIANLGMSRNFETIDLAHLTFPAHMRIDYIRVYQPAGAINIGCDPKRFPTEAYINQYIEAYTNPNLTSWKIDYQQPWPKNSFLGQC